MLLDYLRAGNKIERTQGATTTLWRAEEEDSTCSTLDGSLTERSQPPSMRIPMIVRREMVLLGWGTNLRDKVPKRI